MYPPTAAISRLAIPCELSSRSRFASRWVASSTALVLSSLHAAHDDEPSGRPEEPADHRIGNKTYRPACMRNAKDKQHRSSEGGTERHDDDRTLQEMFGRALGDNPLEECGDERGHDGRGRAVGPGDCKWQRTAQPDDQARNRGGEERDRNPVAEPLCEGAGENQRRVG